ncbi:MAG: FtsK/SpoIIIE domain-containing protein, partial [Actinomycetes bacterium]
MRLWLTIVDPSKLTGPVDCAVEAESAVELGEVRDQLLAAVGSADGALFCDGVALPDSSRLGRSPLVQGAVLTVGVPMFGQPRGLLELRVTGGPDAGSVHRLGPGEHGIGRAVEATVRIDDPDVSRLHAVLRVGAELTTVHDLDSTNGTTVDGAAVGRDGRPLLPGQVLRVGESELRLVLPELMPVSCREVGDGAVELNRPPRLLTASPSTVVTMPSPPTAREPARLPVIAMVLPLVAGLALVAVTGSPTYLLFVLLSPLMILGNFLSDRVGGRRRAREQHHDHREATARAVARISDAVDDEARILHERHPDAATLLQTAAGPRPRLWERRREDADFLDLRIGLGDLPASVEVRRPGDPGDGPDEEVPRLTSVPVVVPLGVVGVLGIAGPRPRALALGRCLLAQLAGWHSPRHLGLVLLVDDPARGGEWEWVRGVPHLRPVAGEDAALLVGLGPDQVGARVDELLEVLDGRLAAAERRAVAAGACRPVVVLLDGAGGLRRRPGVARLLEHGPAVGLRVVCLDTHVVALPAECAATVEITGDVSTRSLVTVRGRAPVTDVVTDGVGERWATRFARSLAPVRDATPGEESNELPPHARLLDLLTFDVTEPAALETAWRVTPRSTEVVLGAGPDDEAYTVDLRRDGPHVLVAGTTGSGKSELLQTLVAGLAVVNRPDEMSFVLIDYKGGAAFKDCARLPHTVGCVTDLDGHLTERALTSLTAELRRREAALRVAGCKDLDDYLSAGRAASGRDAPALPRLVLVVDEFATLAEELPDFVGGLVSIAQRGRSLGVHLVLATQRPAGVVSANIRANTSLR